MRPVPSRSDIDQFARALIILNGQTTTLEVKEALRNRGFWIKQNEIRNGMLDITSRNGDIEYVDNGTHRIYLFKPGVTPPPIPSSVQTVATDHIYQWKMGTGNVCAACGKSQVAIEAFGWKNCTPSVKSVVAPTAVSTAPSPLARVHRDLVKADYSVLDVYGLNRRIYRNVTRPEAKQKWAKEIGRRLFEARTKKL